MAAPALIPAILIGINLTGALIAVVSYARKLINTIYHSPFGRVMLRLGLIYVVFRVAGTLVGIYAGEPIFCGATAYEVADILGQIVATAGIFLDFVFGSGGGKDVVLCSFGAAWRAFVLAFIAGSVYDAWIYGKIDETDEQREHN